jgi:hypothetical protein
MRSFWLLLGVTALVIVSAPCGGQAEFKGKPEVDTIIQGMGYGAGIHHFKNYVLRNTDDYMSGAEEEFKKAEMAVATILETEDLSAEKKSAAMAVQLVIQSYLRALPVVQSMIAAGHGVEDIDRVVKIADAPGIWGLEVLREGSQWNNLQELEYVIGYGGAIHNFKNFVLRGGRQVTDVVGGDTDKYRSAAEAQFTAAEALVEELRKGSGTDEQVEALDKIAGVLAEYKGNLAVAQQMHSEGKPIQEIDAAVKVDDTPATTGIATLRAAMGG